MTDYLKEEVVTGNVNKWSREQALKAWYDLMEQPRRTHLRIGGEKELMEDYHSLLVFGRYYVVVMCLA